MSSRFKLLILDYGGVYSFPYTSKNFNTIILNTFGRIPNEAERQRIIEKSHLLGENKIPTAQYITYLGEIMNTGKLPSEKQFEDATIEVTNPPTSEMIELVANVRKSGVKVSLLSDMYMFEVQRTRPWGRYEGFDHVSFSAEAGMTKWNPHFFEDTLTHFGIEAQEALFVDDVIKNIEVAQTVGIATLFADKEKYPQVDKLVDEIYGLLELNRY